MIKYFILSLFLLLIGCHDDVNRCNCLCKGDHFKIDEAKYNLVLCDCIEGEFRRFNLRNYHSRCDGKED